MIVTENVTLTSKNIPEISKRSGRFEGELHSMLADDETKNQIRVFTFQTKVSQRVSPK